MSSSVIPDQSVDPNFMEDSAGPSDFQQGQKILKKARQQGAIDSAKREEYISKLAKQKTDLNPATAKNAAIREYSRLVQLAAIKIQKQYPEMTLAEAKIQGELEVLSKPNYIKMMGDQAGKAVNKAKQQSYKVAQTAAKSIPFIGWILSFLLGKKWFQQLLEGGLKILLALVCCVCCLCFLLFMQMIQSFTSDNKEAIFQSANLISCAGLPKDIQNPNSEESKKILECMYNQKVDEYSEADPKPDEQSN
jgi:hypothetical protein